MAGWAVRTAEFITQAQLAARVERTGGSAPRLDLAADVAADLDVPNEVVTRLSEAPIRSQLDVLAPFISRYLAAEKENKAKTAAVAAAALARSVRDAVQTSGEGFTLPAAALASLSAVSGYSALRLDAGDDHRWAFPRTGLAKTLHSIRRCTHVVVQLTGETLRVTYVNESGGEGRIILLDQGDAVGHHGVLTLYLPRRDQRAATATAAIPARATPPRAGEQRHWLTDAIFDLADQLLAG